MIKHNNNISILVVDDDRNCLDLLFKALRKLQFKIFIAENGKSALRLASQVNPDIILLDVMMPDINGFEVCRRLKADPETARIPIVFMTGMTETVDKLKGFDVGGADYITKPFDCDELIVRLQTQLNIQRLQTEVRQERNRFRRLSEAASEGIVIYDREYITEANRAAENITGYSITELIGRNIFDLFMPESHDLIHDKMRDRNERDYKVRGMKKDGGTVVLKIREKTMPYRGNEISILTMNDISYKKALEQENRELHLSLMQAGRFGDMVGISPAMKKVYKNIMRASKSNETVILTGETGTGKELAARMIFEKSRCHKRAFITANCASVPESLFESQFFGHRKGAFTGADDDMPGFFDRADGGTLFIDEIGELKPAMQAKLLRVLENGEYIPAGSSDARIADVRIIAATNRDIREMLDNGDMRADFFHRLNVIGITLPPLRHRKLDIPLLVEHFLTSEPLAGKNKSGGAPPAISDEVLRQLHSYTWPGNVRELFNVLRRYRTNGKLNNEDFMPAAVETEDIPFIKDDLSLGKAVKVFEQYYIKRILNRCGGKKKRTAEVLGVNRRTLYNKLTVRHSVET
ncbi:sigma-54-dependent Fis family transcriptional regulator [Desulfococcaceae bacterium HSG7]|nr:sigma-54-dependent Fis family transcriptional regulator [Desulfococcaceae bacterium HSG7]